MEFEFLIQMRTLWLRVKKDFPFDKVHFTSNNKTIFIEHKTKRVRSSNALSPISRKLFCAMMNVIQICLLC